MRKNKSGKARKIERLNQILSFLKSLNLQDKEHVEEKSMERTKDYWKSPKWLTLRTKIFARDAYTCQKCGATDKPLVGHHLAYIKGREIWEYPEAMVVTLCGECHQTHHDECGVRVYTTEQSAMKDLYGEPMAKAMTYNEQTSEATSIAPESTGESVVSVSVITTTTTDKPRKKKRTQPSKGKNGNSCTAVIDPKTYRQIMQLSDDIGMSISKMMRPFAKLCLKLRDKVITCESEDDITGMLYSLMA
jgi:hypothetical protein